MANLLRFLERPLAGVLLASVVLVAACGGSSGDSSHAVSAYSTMRAFGDSLSDTGNDKIQTSGSQRPDPPPTSYYDGRFSNGLVAVEYLWQSLSGHSDAKVVPSLQSDSGVVGRDAVSYAYGGSSTGGIEINPDGYEVRGLQAQVDAFEARLANQRADGRALYVIWAGANDYLFFGETNPSAVVQKIEQAIDSLYRLGARHFLVPNLPNLGATPLTRASGSSATAESLTRAHNAMLDSALQRLRAGLYGASLHSANLFDYMNARLQDGSLNGSAAPGLEQLTNDPRAAYCLLQPSIQCPAVPMSPSAPEAMREWNRTPFWDALHPTTRVHQMFAEAMLESLRQP